MESELLTALAAIGGALVGCHAHRLILPARIAWRRLSHRRHDWHSEGTVVHNGVKHHRMYCTGCPAKRLEKMDG